MLFTPPTSQRDGFAWSKKEFMIEMDPTRTALMIVNRENAARSNCAEFIISRWQLERSAQPKVYIFQLDNMNTLQEGEAGPTV